MADDTRQSESKPTEEVTKPEVRRPRRPKPKHDFPKTQAGKLWDAFGNPDEPINEMPGGMVNTAGGRPKDVTWRDAFQNPFKTRDGRVFYQVPCARDALIVGILAGGGVGGVRFILKGMASMLANANWAVGGFAVASSGQYTWCEMRRREEAKGMVAAVAGMKMLNEKKAQERAVEEAAQKAAQQAEEEAKRSRPWYKVW